jgi:hypothetical protein
LKPGRTDGVTRSLEFLNALYFQDFQEELQPQYIPADYAFVWVKRSCLETLNSPSELRDDAGKLIDGRCIDGPGGMSWRSTAQERSNQLALILVGTLFAVSASAAIEALRPIIEGTRRPDATTKGI